MKAEESTDVAVETQGFNVPPLFSQARSNRWWNHSDVVRELQEIGIESLYHFYTKEQQGKETQPTFFLHRNREKSYHIDNCFASMNFVDQLKKVTVCNYEGWKHLSDHAPMAITLGN